MSFYLEVRLPIGLKVKAEYREQFSGTIKTLLGVILEDLEENTNRNYSYFLRERLSKKEKKILVALLQEVREEHHTVDVAVESLNNSPLIDFIQQIERYSNAK